VDLVLIGVDVVDDVITPAAGEQNLEMRLAYRIYTAHSESSETEQLPN